MKIVLLCVQTDFGYLWNNLNLLAGGNGKFTSGLRNASDNTQASCALPSQPACIKVNFMSKSQAASTLVVRPPFLARYACALSAGGAASINVPSMAPTQSCTCHKLVFNFPKIVLTILD